MLDEKKAGLCSALWGGCLLNVDGPGRSIQRSFGEKVVSSDSRDSVSLGDTPQTMLLAWLHQLQFLRHFAFLHSTLIPPYTDIFFSGLC